MKNKFLYTNPLLAALLLGVFTLYPASAFAHTGLGNTSGMVAGFSHPFTGLDHLLTMLAVGLWAAQIGGKSTWIIPGAFVSMMVLGAVLAISGIQLPYVEAGILASVFVLGLLIVFACRLPVIMSAIMVGAFAIFHGHAHGNEMPLAMEALSYGTGFGIGTALLHAIGIAAGMTLQKINTEKAFRFIGGVIAFSGVCLAVA